MNLIPLLATAAHVDGSASIIHQLVFDGCTGKIEVMGTPGAVRYCYVNQHVGGYEEISASVDGHDGVTPGVTFIRGLPLDLATCSDSPEALPLIYPEPGETISVGWLLKDAVVLIEVVPATAIPEPPPTPPITVMVATSLSTTTRNNYDGYLV